MNRKLADLVLMGALMIGSGYEESDSKGIRETAERSKFKRKIIPKGCKLYTYVESFGTLEVIAHNEKKALEKYKKWFDSNSA